MKAKYTRTIVIEGEKDWVDRTIKQALVTEVEPQWNCTYGKIYITHVSYEQEVE